MALTKGQQAPLFKLYNTDKKEVSLGDYNGKNLLILFFPLAFTSTCTTELCSMRDDIATYNNLNTDVVGISNDSVFVLKKFKEEQNLNFPLLSDFNKTASVAYGTLYDEFILGMKGVAKRSAFVVDKSGVIQYAQVLETSSDLPDFEAIKKTIAQLN